MLYGDYHTHSIYSKDAKSTITDNVNTAIDKGLKEIACSEHGYFHMYGMKPADFESQIREVERINAGTTIRVLKAVEANLIDQSGKIDIPRNMQDKLDIVILGYHKSSGAGFFDKRRHAKMRKLTPKNIELNTYAYIKALQNNPKIAIVAHPNYACPVDCVRLAKFCKEHNIFFELNGRKHCIDDKTFRQVVDTGVMFILDSDAHIATNVGNVRLGLTIAEKFDIPENQIANLNKVPNFDKRC